MVIIWVSRFFTDCHVIVTSFDFVTWLPYLICSDCKLSVHTNLFLKSPSHATHERCMTTVTLCINIAWHATQGLCVTSHLTVMARASFGSPQCLMGECMIECSSQTIFGRDIVHKYLICRSNFTLLEVVLHLKNSFSTICKLAVKETSWNQHTVVIKKITA